MKRYNTVETIEGYIAQGFTVEEAPKAQRHDILFNKWVDGIITEEEDAEMEALVEELGL